MKILSTGDWHFNAGYDDDVLASVGQIRDYIMANDVDALFVTGDVYDKASDPKSRNLAAEQIQHIAERVPVLIVRGNHDAPGDLNILAKLHSVYPIRVFETPTDVIYQTLKDDKPIKVQILPWITKARWLALHPEATKEESDRTVSQLILEYLRNNVALGAGMPVILVAHLTIAGARAEHRQQMGADGVTLGLYDIAEAGYKAAMLGHIHLRQEIGASTYFYNGSIAPLDYGENPEKFFSVLDTKTWEVEWVRLKTVHRQDINAHFTPNGTVIDEQNLDIRQLFGARVRVNLRVEGGENVALAKQKMTEWLERWGVLEYKINPQVISVTKVRAVEISNCVKMSDKLKQYWQATEQPEEANDMLDKLAQVEDECSL